MRKTTVLALAGLAVAAFAVPAFLSGANSPANAQQTVDRAEIETIIREYLLANPEIMLEVQRALEAKQREQQRVSQRATIDRSAEAIFNAQHDGVVGNPEGDVTVVEFFDYNCGYCKRALADMEAMVAADPNLRFVLKEFPILGPDSQGAHMVSMAFRNLAPERYGEFHTRLLNSEGRVNEAVAIELAEELGQSEAAIRAEMQNPAIVEAFSETFDLADDLSITGTPSYVVGDEVVFGALGERVLAQKVANMRQCESATC